MQRTDFSELACSIARTMAVVGEPWSLLIIRDVWVGITRFDDLHDELGVSRKVLAERLRLLVAEGVLERRQYSERPPRFEYVLTEKGAELTDILMTITAWGDRWTAGTAGPPALLRHRACGHVTHAEVHCAVCGQAMHGSDVDVQPGPGAARAPEGGRARRSGGRHAPAGGDAG